MRKHLWHGHEKAEYLLESQHKRLVHKENDHKISVKRKKELDDAVINCIIQDSRTYGDFSKSGMKQFLSIAVPGYTPPTERTIYKHFAIKYFEYRKNLKLVL